MICLSPISRLRLPCRVSALFFGMAALAGCGSGVATPASFPQITLSASSLAFGNQVVGASPISQTVTVTNTGGAPLTFSSLTVSVPGSPFSLAGTCSQSSPVSAGAKCTIVVAFAPTSVGSQTASITLTDNASPAVQAIALSGTAYSALSVTATTVAGSLPVSGATLQLYSPGTSGNGSTATSLINTSLTTDGSGVVVLPGQFTCASSSSQLYLVSRGGTVGSSTAPNPGLVMMTVLGPCSQLIPGTRFVVNEATTVAAIAALAPFYSAGGMVGASATNTVGLGNAFASAAELTNPATGTSPGATLPANAISPTARVYSLANQVNACASSASACAGFFSAATLPGGVSPTNTLDALYNVVHNPANNVASLYAGSQASSAYSPALAAAPSDWTFFLTLSGAGMNGPSGLGVDSTGSLWVASYFGTASKFNPLGGAVFASGVTGDGLNNSYGLAIDPSDNAWIPNEQPYTAQGIGSVSEISPAGASLAGASGYIAGGMNYPISVAIDPNTTTWVVDYGNSHLTLLNASGKPLSGTSGYASSQLSFPVAVVVDGNHFGWVANQSSTTVTKVSPDGSSFTSYSCCNGASGLAIDQANNVWVANYYGASVSLISNTGTVLSSGFTGSNGIDHPQGVAIDGAGNVWVANYRKPYLSELAGVQAAGGLPPGTSLTPATGYGADAQLLEAYAIAADASGALWITNFGSNKVTKFLGLAVPVKTPLSGVPQLP